METTKRPLEERAFDIADKLFDEGTLETGVLFDTHEDILVVDDSDLSDDEWEGLQKFAELTNQEIYGSEAIVSIGDLFYLARGNNWIAVDNYQVGLCEIIKKKYDLDDIINEYSNNFKKALPTQFFELLEKDFDAEGFVLDDKVYTVRFGDNKHQPEKVYNKLKNKYDVIFVLVYNDPFNVSYQLLLKPKHA